MFKTRLTMTGWVPAETDKKEKALYLLKMKVGGTCMLTIEEALALASKDYYISC